MIGLVHSQTLMMFRTVMVISKFSSCKIDLATKINLVIKTKIDKTALDMFVSRTKSHSDFYGMKIWQDYSQIELEINTILENNHQKIKEFLTQREICYNCSAKLGDEADALYDAFVYNYGNGSQSCYIGSKICYQCKSEHYLNYVDIPLKGRYFFPDLAESKYVAFTWQIIFDTLLLQSIKLDFFHKHTSFFAVCNFYNDLFNLYNESKGLRNALINKRVSEAWFQYQLILFDIEYYKSNQLVGNSQ